MKKAQILSAIALAFALGVVAPVAGVVISADTYAVQVTTPQDKVSTADLKAAIAKAEGYTNYKNYQVLLTVSTANQTTYTDINTAELLDGVADDNTKNGINGAIRALDNTYTGNKVATTLDAAVAVAESTVTKEDYNNFKALYDAINDDVNRVNFATLSQLVKDAGFEITLADNEKESTSALITAVTAQNEYKAYAALIEAVQAIKDAQETQAKNIDALTTALKAWGAQTDAIIDKAAEQDNPVASLVALTGTALSDKKVESNGAMVTLASLYNTLATKIGDAKTAANGNSETANATALKNMETAFYNATGLVLSTVSTPSNPSTSDPSTPGTTTPTNTITDGDVTVTGPIAEGVKVKAIKTDKKVAAFGDRNYAVYDIYLTDANNDKVSVEGTVKVSIKVPANIDGSKASVYYINEKDEGQKIADAKYADGYITFTTTHFSYYAIVEDEGKLDATLPNTGIMTSATGSASSTVAVVAGIATALTAAGAGVVAYRNARREA